MIVLHPIPFDFVTARADCKRDVFGRDLCSVEGGNNNHTALMGFPFCFNVALEAQRME